MVNWSEVLAVETERNGWIREQFSLRYSELVHSLEGKVRNTEQGQTVLWMAS